MSVIWRYILVLDDGLSPCPDDGRLTLARRKPGLRMRAEPGDWVLALVSRKVFRDGNAIAWAGRVAANPTLLDYSLQYPGRADSLELTGSLASLAAAKAISNRKYDADSDLQPIFQSRRGLVFEPFWYWGNNSTVVLQDGVADFATRHSGERHRVEAAERIVELEQWLRTIAEPGVHGRPRDRNAAAKGVLKRLRDQ